MNSTLGNTQERSEDATPESLQQTLEGLKEGLKKSPSGEHLFLRIYRAISWIRCAQEAGELAKNHGEGEDDGAFIFYWIAFDCLYAQSKWWLKQQSRENRKAKWWSSHQSRGSVQKADWRSRESRKFCDFFNKVLKCDDGDRIYGVIKAKFQNPILLILGNPYIYEHFWEYNETAANPEDRGWEHPFLARKDELRQALTYAKNPKNTGEILSTLFESLYVLRNQLMHGSATWKSSVNRTQVKDGAEILSHLIPIIIDLMMKNPQENWGKPAFLVMPEMYQYEDRGEGVKTYNTEVPYGDGDK